MEENELIIFVDTETISEDELTTGDIYEPDNQRIPAKDS